MEAASEQPPEVRRRSVRRCLIGAGVDEIQGCQPA